MLTQTRRIGETLIIGNNDANITVLGINGNQVKLGIVAPKELPVYREELYERIQLEKAQAQRQRREQEQGDAALEACGEVEEDSEARESSNKEDAA